MEYIIIVLLLLYLIYKYDVLGYQINRDKWFKFTCVIFIFLSGLRYRVGLDTIVYLDIFYNRVDILSKVDWSYVFGGETDPFYYILQSGVKTFFGRFVYLQIIQSLIVNVLIFKYIKKHSKSIFTCALIYFIWRYFTFTAEEMRASVALSICLFANDFALENKRLKSIVLYVLASMFHTSAIFLVFIPILTFLRFNKVGYIVIISSFSIGVLLQTLFGDIIEMLSFASRFEELGSRYEGSAFSEQYLNINGIISKLTVYVFYTIYIIQKLRKKSPESNVLRFEPLLLIGVILSIVSIPLAIVYRYCHFFDIYFILLYSEYMTQLKTGNYKYNVTHSLKGYIFFFPFLFFVLYSYNSKVPYSNSLKTYSRYYPYHSVLTKRIDTDRESLFSCYNSFYFNERY